MPRVGKGDVGDVVTDVQFLKGDTKMQGMKPKRPVGNPQAQSPGLLPDRILCLCQKGGNFLQQPPDPEGKEYDEEEPQTDPPRPSPRHKGKL